MFLKRAIWNLMALMNTPVLPPWILGMECSDIQKMGNSPLVNSFLWLSPTQLLWVFIGWSKSYGFGAKY